jgi:hypothetical protein
MEVDAGMTWRLGRGDAENKKSSGASRGIGQEVRLADLSAFCVQSHSSTNKSYVSGSARLRVSASSLLRVF